MPPVVMIGPTGDTVEVEEGNAELFASRGYRTETTEQAEARYDADFAEEKYGGAADKFTALRSGIGSTLTLGASDLIPKSERLKGAIKANEGYHTAGQIAGAIVPALIPGGQGVAAGRLGGLGKALSKSPAAAAERLGVRASQAAGGGFKGAAARGATEGVLFGAASGVTELSLDDDPLTLERAASTLSSRALLGGLTGGAVGVFGKAAEKGLARAGKALDARRAAAAGAPTEGAKVVDDLAAYTQSRNQAFAIARGEHKAVLAQQARRVRDALDAPETLAKRPQQLAATLEKEGKVLRELVEEGQEKTLATLAESDQRVATFVREQLEAAKPSAKTIKLPQKIATEYRDVMGKGGGKGSIKLSMDKAQEFLVALKGGELAATRQRAIAELPALLEQNTALRAAVDAANTKPAAGLLDQAKSRGMDYAALSVAGVLPGGMLGAAGAMIAPRLIGKLDDLVSGRLAKAGADVAGRTELAVARALRVGEKVTRAAERSTPAAAMGATKILSRVSFSPEVPASRARQYAPSGDKLTEVYRQREQELLSQAQAGPQPGTYEMRPAARQQMAQRLSGARAVSPQLADRIETLLARRVSYLASKLPKRPDVAAMSVGPDRWRPSDAQMRQFARTVQAVEDPASVAERITSGTITRADIEALREVYPEQLRDLQRQIAEQLPTLRHSLPYETRLALSIVTGVPVVPATAPRILAVLQAQYATEPGTDGGAHAPRAQPQFGSVKKPTETAAQARANPQAPA